MSESERRKRMLARYVSAMRHGGHYDEFNEFLDLMRSETEHSKKTKILERTRRRSRVFTFFVENLSLSLSLSVCVCVCVCVQQHTQ